MYFYYRRRPSEASAYMVELRDRATASGRAVFAVAAMAVGLFLVLDGLVGLNIL
jgi:hypothetical protein